MKKLLIVYLTLLTVSSMLLLTGCSAIFNTTKLGEVVNKTYDFKDFNNVDISSAFQYEITRSDLYSVVVSTNENMFEHMDVHQSGNTLYIGMKFLFSGSNPKITITMPQLNKLAVSGDCRGSATGFVSASDLEIDLSGASRMEADFKVVGEAADGLARGLGRLARPAGPHLRPCRYDQHRSHRRLGQPADPGAERRVSTECPGRCWPGAPGWPGKSPR